MQSRKNKTSKQTGSGSASPELDSPKLITGNARCWLWARPGSWNREQKGHQDQGSVYEIDCCKFNGQAGLNLNWSFSTFLFFFLLPSPPPYRKFFYSEIFYGSDSVEGNIQGLQNLVSGAAMENVSNRVLQRPTGWGLEKKLLVGWTEDITLFVHHDIDLPPTVLLCRCPTLHMTHLQSIGPHAIKKFCFSSKILDNMLNVFHLP